MEEHPTARLFVLCLVVVLLVLIVQLVMVLIALARKTLKWLRMRSRMRQLRQARAERKPLVERIKRCPRCGMMVEHIGGCADMWCVCGRSFNWDEQPFVVPPKTVPGGGLIFTHRAAWRKRLGKDLYSWVFAAAAPPECGICMARRCNAELACGHKLCDDCVRRIITRGKRKCPWCAREIRHVPRQLATKAAIASMGFPRA
jgi:hypothetical protein